MLRSYRCRVGSDGGKREGGDGWATPSSLEVVRGGLTPKSFDGRQQGEHAEVD